MSNPYQSYQAATATAAGPSGHRGLEAQALLATARDLKTVLDNWDTAQDRLDDALERNKMLWTFFASEIPDNAALPDEVKQNLLNLSLYVFKQTMAMFGKPTQQGVNSLVNINRTLAIGLMAQDG